MPFLDRIRAIEEKKRERKQKEAERACREREKYALIRAARKKLKEKQRRQRMEQEKEQRLRAEKEQDRKERMRKWLYEAARTCDKCHGTGKEWADDKSKPILYIIESGVLIPYKWKKRLVPCSRGCPIRKKKRKHQRSLSNQKFRSDLRRN